MAAPALVRRFFSGMRSTYGIDNANQMQADAAERYALLCQAHPDEPPAMQRHTRGSIYPAIAACQAMEAAGVPREEAIAHMQRFILQQGAFPAKLLRTILKIPGLYRRAPRFFAQMTRRNYGEQAGFAATWHEASDEAMQFDMTVCPYHTLCTQYGYPELVAAYCEVDDLLYAHMHPKIQWLRTKTLGKDGNCCDFHVRIKKDAASSV